MIWTTVVGDDDCIVRSNQIDRAIQLILAVNKCELSGAREIPLQLLHIQLPQKPLGLQGVRRDRLSSNH